MPFAYLALNFIGIASAGTVEEGQQTSKTGSGFSSAHRIDIGTAYAMAAHDTTPNYYPYQQKHYGSGGGSRRQRRGNSKSNEDSPRLKQQQQQEPLNLPTRGTTSLRRNAKAKSGQLLAIELLTDREAENRAAKKINEQLSNLTLGVVLAESYEQLTKLKELLKLALYFQQLLELFNKEWRNERELLEDAKTVLIQMDSSKKGQMADQQKLVADLQKNMNQMEEISGKIKNEMDGLLKMAESDEEFYFARHINRMKERDNQSPFLHDTIVSWEKQKPYEWDRQQMRIWVKRHSTNEAANELHPLYPLAKRNDTNERLVRNISHLLMLDAAFDREARELCRQFAARVPLRNWAVIAKDMDDEAIKKFVVRPLKQFEGLDVEFNAKIQPEQVDEATADQVEEKHEQKHNAIKEMWHKFLHLFNPYDARDVDTHQRELSAQQEKCVWEMLSAMSQGEREKAKECVKGSLFIQLFIEQVFSEEQSQKLQEAKDNVDELKEVLAQLERKFQEFKAQQQKAERDAKEVKEAYERRRRTRRGIGEKSGEKVPKSAAKNKGKAKMEEAHYHDDDDDDDVDDNDDDEDDSESDTTESSGNEEEAESSSAKNKGRSATSKFKRIMSGITPKRKTKADKASKSNEEEEKHDEMMMASEDEEKMMKKQKQKQWKMPTFEPPPSARRKSSRQRNAPSTSSRNTKRQQQHEPLRQIDEDSREGVHSSDGSGTSAAGAGHRRLTKNSISTNYYINEWIDQQPEEYDSYNDRINKLRAQLREAEDEYKKQEKGLKGMLNVRKHYRRLRLNKKSKSNSSQQPIVNFFGLHNELMAEWGPSSNNSSAEEKAIFMKIYDDVVENAKKQIEEHLRRCKKPALLNEYLEKRARELFAAGPGQDFLRNMLQLSSQMTAAEKSLCAQEFRRLNHCAVYEIPEKMELNGSGVKPTRDAAHAAAGMMEHDNNVDYACFFHDKVQDCYEEEDDPALLQEWEQLKRQTQSDVQQNRHSGSINSASGRSSDASVASDRAASSPLVSDHGDNSPPPMMTEQFYDSGTDFAADLDREHNSLNETINTELAGNGSSSSDSAFPEIELEHKTESPTVLKNIRTSQTPLRISTRTQNAKVLERYDSRGEVIETIKPSKIGRKKTNPKY
ncbi:hypothetical protein niasHT_024618 [Heterodera trifolii]|uniref:Uncharacterized protein n=1 Tax=Heterodera trifolii TaxID=157864 RepID=A0ABD2K7N8_9BILA